RGEYVEHPETVRLRKDGTRIDVWVRISPFHNASGEIVGASRIARHIGDRKRTEQLLLQQTLDLEAAQAQLSAKAEFAGALNQAGMLDTYRAALGCIARTTRIPLAVIYDAAERESPV